jgi:hypothetical protein
LALPGKPQPEAAVVLRTRNQTDAADQRTWIALEPERLVPLNPAFDRRQCDVAAKLPCSIGRIRPRNYLGQVTHDFPPRKENLDFVGIRNFQLAKKEAHCFKRKSHAQAVSGGAPPGAQ